MKPKTCLIVNLGLCTFNTMEYFNTGISTFAILSFVCGLGFILALHETARGDA